MARKLESLPNFTGEFPREFGKQVSQGAGRGQKGGRKGTIRRQEGDNKETGREAEKKGEIVERKGKDR